MKKFNIPPALLIVLLLIGFPILIWLTFHPTTVKAEDNLEQPPVEQVEQTNVTVSTTTHQGTLTETVKILEAPIVPYTDEELDEMSRLIASEAGSTWIPDLIQRYVGSVALNRVKHSLYPNTLHEVIYQPWQYGPVTNGSFETVVPDERTIENAKFILTHGSILPDNVVFQDNNIQGDGIYYQYDDPRLGPTYFCYLNH